MNKVCSFQFNRQAISCPPPPPPPRVRLWGWASCSFFSFIVFFLFGFSSYIVHLRCTVEGGGGWGGMVSMFNKTAHSVFVRERLLPCRVAVGSMGCIVYTDYVYPAFDLLLADIFCLLFLFRKWVFCFFCVCFFLFFPTMCSFLFAISYPLDSLPD